MSIKIGLAGNPNCGKTTLFNELTGSNQFVGNWPGVTVEKKEGKLKQNKEVTIVDLPGIYSLSPYSLEEVVTRNYLITEKPDVILNIIDGTNIERNLYLSMQLMELGIPLVMAVNMMDIVEKHGKKINIKKLSESFGCEIVLISALKNTGIEEVSKKVVEIAALKSKNKVVHKFQDSIENVIHNVEEKIANNVPEEQRRFFAIKLIEKDDKILTLMDQHINILDEIKKLEEEFEDDTDSIIANERYNYITEQMEACGTKSSSNKLTISDKIDKVVTNRWLALPIFAIVMILVYSISVTTVGTWATDWANDGVFGDGWHLFGYGSKAFEDSTIEYAKAEQILAGNEEGQTNIDILDEEEKVIETIAISDKIVENAVIIVEKGEPEPTDYGIYIKGVPILIEGALDSIGCANWLKSLIIDGIIAGVGAVLGFVPQMLVLFLFLAFLEACGYMARVAFIMDRIFRKFGLSGKSFIPMLIGSGCGVPGIMASRTIENDRDRKITIMTTTFIPCGAKLPIIALIAGAMFQDAWWVAPSAYFVGILAIICSGIILKKTKLFAGDVAPFVMELPEYHMPTIKNMLLSMWERGWSFIKKAGTIILLSSIILWFLMSFGWNNGTLKMLEGEELNHSILASIGKIIAPLFYLLGWGDWRSSVATVTGLIAKENVVGTFGVLYGFGEVSESGTEIWHNLQSNMTALSAYSFLVFNLLCAPCFAAIGAIKREMNNTKWLWIAIGYQTLLAYGASLCLYQIGNLVLNGIFGIGTIIAIILMLGFIYLLIRPQHQFHLNKIVRYKKV